MLLSSAWFVLLETFSPHQGMSLSLVYSNSLPHQVSKALYYNPSATLISSNMFIRKLVSLLLLVMNPQLLIPNSEKKPAGNYYLVINSKLNHLLYLRMYYQLFTAAEHFSSQIYRVRNIMPVRLHFPQSPNLFSQCITGLLAAICQIRFIDCFKFVFKLFYSWVWSLMSDSSDTCSLSICTSNFGPNIK